MVEDYMSWGMPRCEQHLQFSVPEFHRLTFGEEGIRCCCTVAKETIVRRVGRNSPKVGLFDGVYVERYFESILDERVPEYVVDVAVGIKKHDDPQSRVLYVLDEFVFLMLFVASRIDYDAFPCFVIYDVGVFLERVEYERHDLGHASGF